MCARGTFDPITNTNTGTITNSGLLDGPYVEAFHGVVVPTPDAMTVSFPSDDVTFSTNQGELKARNVIVLNVVTGNAAVLGHLDPTRSTGRFEGATGVLYFARKTLSFDPFVAGAEISGEICPARE